MLAGTLKMRALCTRGACTESGGDRRDLPSPSAWSSSSSTLVSSPTSSRAEEDMVGWEWREREEWTVRGEGWEKGYGPSFER